MKKTTFILWLSLTTMAYAQDTQYWTQQYGTRSALLGGAVVGGTNDYTAIFYNPGILGFIDTGSLSINANLYKLENIKIENAVGKQQDFKSNNIGTLPLLLSGAFRTRNPRLKLGYGLIVPTEFSFDATARIDDDIQIVDDVESPGLEAFIGQASLSTKLHETRIGFGLGYNLNEHWSIGISNLFTFRSHNFERNILSRFFLNTPDMSLVSGNIIQKFNYSQLRYSAKLGVAYQGKNIDLGLSFNTPAWRLIYGKGTVAVDVTANNLLFEGQRIDVLGDDRQEDIKANYKEPFNVSAGVNYRMHKSMIGFAIQYYGGQEIYNIMQANPSAFVRPEEVYDELGSDEFLLVKTAAKPVLNAVIGYEYVFNRAFTLNTSFRTDQTYFDSDLVEQRGIKPDVSSWDIFHFTAGGTYRRGRAVISMGLLTSYGVDNDKKQNSNLSNPNETNFLQGAVTITKASYSAMGLLLGFSFSL